jgi:hypothetical protein
VQYEVLEVLVLLGELLASYAVFLKLIASFHLI